MSEVPIIEVYTDQMIYEDLMKEQLTINTNRPTSPLNRFFTDLLGLGLVYAGTFLICDVIRTFKTGEWTRLYWMILGPWNYITGTPIIKRLHDSLGQKPTAQDCNEAYLEAQYEATWNRRGEQPIPDADMERAMAQNVRDYKRCMEQTREGFAGEGCYKDARDNFNECFDNTGDASNCFDKYYSDVDRCEDQYLPQSCFVDAVEDYESCSIDQKSNCDTAYYSQVYACDQQQ